MQVYHVVFDLGGVLIDWNPRYLYSKVFSSEQEIEHFLANICTCQWNAEQDAGRPFAQAVSELQQQHPQYHQAIALYNERWEEMIKGAIEGSVSLLQRLHKLNVPLYSLTNWSAEKFPVAQQKFGFLNLFRGIVVSGEIKMRKPDPRIFEHLQQEFQLPPEETLFIDDKWENIEVAKKVGFQVHHFTSPIGLEMALQDLGLLGYSG